MNTTHSIYHKRVLINKVLSGVSYWNTLSETEREDILDNLDR